MPTRENKWVTKVDWTLILIYVILVTFGWMSIYATTSDSNTIENIFDLSKVYGMQLIWIATAFILAFCILMINSRFYSVFSYFIYFAVILMLIALLFLGKEVNGNRAWFSIGSMRFQPAELAKLATSLALAKAMSAYGFKLNTWRGWTQVLAILLLPVALILLQKDWGSAAVFFIFILMFYREGLSGWVVAAAFFTIALFILSLVVEPITILIIVLSLSLLLFGLTTRRITHMLLAATGITVLFFSLYYAQQFINLTNYSNNLILLGVSFGTIVVSIVYGIRNKIKTIYYIVLFFIGSITVSYSVDYVFDNLLKQHHRDRIEDMLGIHVNIQVTGYNVYQAKIAIGSGGLTGKGFLQGTQTKLNFVPEQSTDFIFCTVGEEWGFLGTLFLITLYVTLLIRIIMVAERQKHNFARIYGYCTACILFFHVSINIAMTIGLAPVIGIPLPFLSYGGSSLWSFTLLLFILIKLDAVRHGEH